MKIKSHTGWLRPNSAVLSKTHLHFVSNFNCVFFRRVDCKTCQLPQWATLHAALASEIWHPWQHTCLQSAWPILLSHFCGTDQEFFSHDGKSTNPSLRLLHTVTKIHQMVCPHIDPELPQIVKLQTPDVDVVGIHTCKLDCVIIRNNSSLTGHFYLSVCQATNWHLHKSQKLRCEGLWQSLRWEIWPKCALSRETSPKLFCANASSAICATCWNFKKSLSLAQNA